MKKVFLFLTMLLFAFTGVTRADELTVSDGTATNGYVPVYGYYADSYLKAEAVYPAEDLTAMEGESIFSMAFYASQTSVAWGSTFQVFVTEIDATTLSDFVGMDGATLVYEGTLEIADGVMTIPFATTYTYNGGNLLVGVYNTTTGTYLSSTWYGTEVTGAAVSGYSYSSLDAITATVRNFLPKVTFGYGSGTFSVTPESIDFGYRANGYWMEPEYVVLTSPGAPTTVSTFTSTNTFFTTDATTPIIVGEESVNIPVTTGTATDGAQEGQLVVAYGEGAALIDLTATAYTAVDNDVYELATEVTSFPYQATTTTANLYKNYNLPGINSEAKDAVYTVTFDEPVMFNAGTNGSSPVTYMYKEDFNGQGGPMADNYYEYNGPEVNPGPTNIWFSYDYTGTETFFGSADGGGMYFGYRISAETMQELGLGELSIMAVESAAHDTDTYDLYLLQGDDVATADLLYYQAMESATEGGYNFTLNLDDPVVAGDSEDLWVIMYSESAYAAYTGKVPVDPDNAKIYYSMDGETWTNSTARTPIIYVQFLELPTGREVSMNLADMSIKPINGNGDLSETTHEVKGISKAIRHNEMRAQKSNSRDAIEVLNEGFESGSMPSGWSNSSSYWQVTSGTGHSSKTGSATGNYNAGCYIASYSGSDMLITPEMDMGTYESAALTFNFWNTSWGGDINTLNVYYRVNGGDWTLLYTNNSETGGYTPVEIELTGIADNYQIGFECVSGYSYGMAIDDVLVIAQGEPVPMYQISDMYVPAGTYYVAVASTSEDFQVDMYTEEAPLPNQSFVLSPYNGETGVESPYLAEWILGDYTEEMQVLLGTVYPPTTVLLDWTDELVESMFLADLENNKTYFIQVNERNAMGTVEGDIIGFTTAIDPVEGFAVDTPNLYPGDEAHFTWEANRSIKGYNMYQDGVKINEELITTTEYSVADLEYNMDGYEFQVTSVYDEGESSLSNPITVYMTGNGSVNGHVWEQDSITPVALATVEMRGIDAYGEAQVFSFPTNPSGYYEGELLEGIYIPTLVKEGYQESEGALTAIVYTETTADADIVCYEMYYPLQQITATENTDENNVLVEWNWTPASMIVDFETGDFSQAEFNNTASSYPWEITTTNPYEGVYAMKSTCENVASGDSYIEATVDVPFDGVMGFWVKVSSETNYDKFNFYIDGVQQGASISGDLAYSYKEFAITEGTHTYKWQYVKDGSVNSNDDCVYIDNITMYGQAAPQPGGQTYSFEGSMEGWTTIDADGDGYNWQLGSVLMAGYLIPSHTGADCVSSQSYDASAGPLNPDNYLVSPSKIAAQDGAAISFWACAQDASYAAEHFGVAISTGSNTSASDFTTIQEWTMTAKSNLRNTVDAEHYIRGTKEGTWYQYTVDLSDYAGQEIWVAIRHFNCTDMFYLDVDDVTLGDGTKNRAGDTRMLNNYVLYRRNINGFDDPEEAEVETIANPGTDVYSYTDNAWSSLEYGVYQWGIAAHYEGNQHVTRDRDEVVIGDGTATDTHLPAYNLFNYSLTEQIYTADEIGTAGTINSFSVYCEGSVTRTLDVYMVNTTEETFASGTSWIAPTTSDLVYSGEVTMTAGDWTTITLDTPFAYDGTSNLAIIVDDNTGTWTSSVYYRVFSATSQAIYIYSDGTNYDPTSPSGYTGTVAAVKNQIKLDITAGGGGSTSGMSDVIWSNTIEKDMYSTLTFNVSLSNGQNPAGATIALDGEETYSETVDETGVVEIEVRKGTYDITVALDGYTSYEETEYLVEEDDTFDVVLEEIIATVENLYTSPTGWTMWDGGATPTPPTPPTPGDEEFYDFEADFVAQEILEWTTIDADADGNDWYIRPTALATQGHNNSEGFVTSFSYDGFAGVEPDNYLVSPNKGQYSQISFWACAQDAAYPAEHFGVAVSTASNTSASDFTTIQEWTMTSKEVNGPKMERGLNDVGTWYEYTVDLSAYAGQDIYVAIRHFDCFDMFRLNVDDITLSTSSKGTRAPLFYKVMLDNVVVGETYDNFYQLDVEGMVEGSEHVTAVAPVYTAGMADWTEYAWTYAACDNYAGATEYDATVSGSDVTLTWTLGSTPTPPTPPTPPTGGWTEGFENGMPTGWTVIDANNDGYTWCMTSAVPTTWTYYASLTLDWYRTGTNAICSGSYINGAGALNPDEYLVTPQVTPTAGSTFSFWAAATDAGYPADHFGVAVSTTDASASSFTMLNEWTLTAKSGAANGGRESRDGDGAKLGTWYQYSVDLSSYAGQAIYIAIRHFNCYDQYIMCVDDIEFTTAGKNRVSERDMWDYVASFSGTSAGQQAVATDGEFIYTASWQSTPTGGYTFYKYELNGTFVEGFNIAGATGIRDLTFDGTYFYGSSGGAQIFCLDLTNKTLVSTINCSGLTSRHLSYDPERDGFWSGNWTTLALYDRTGALVQSAAAPVSAYGSAYYKDADGVEHLYLFCQPDSDAKVYDYNIGTNTISTSPVLDFASTPAFNAGIAGGCFIGAYDNKTCWFGNAQQDPNLIGIYELSSSGPVPPTPPTPGDVLGVMIYRNGELLTPEIITATTYVDEDVPAGEYEYCIRVVYSDYAMACAQCETVEVGETSCDPVTNLTATLYEYEGNLGALVEFTEPEGATAYKVYVDGVELGSISGQPIFINFAGSEAGDYTIGIVAVYADCESDMVEAVFTYPGDSTPENEVVNAIYPNPVSGDLHIEAPAMTRVSVYNTMGQMVYDQAVSGDETILNMAQYEAGVYVVRISTESGVSVKRVTVVK